MNRSVLRRDLGDMLVPKRDFFPTYVEDLKATLAVRPFSQRMLYGFVDRARYLLGMASWFAPASQLLFDCVQLQSRAAYGSALVVAASIGEIVEVPLGDTRVPVLREDRTELGSIPEWTDAWCAALVGRDQPTIDGMRAVPDDRFRNPTVQVDDYNYALKDAFFALVDDRDRCCAAVARGRDLWKQRTVAMRSAADIDAALFDAIEALATERTGPFNDALFRALTAHAKHWTKGDEYLAAEGWVALRHLALVCVAHDRGVPVEIESPYLPRALVERELVPEPSLRAGATPLMIAEADVAAQTRALALLAGEAFARLDLEPHGYRRVEIEYIPLAGFDHIYVHGDDVVLIDTQAADEEPDAAHGLGGGVVEVGTRPYAELMIANMRKRRPDVAQVIATALAAGRLRYFEVRQPIDDAGDLGDIEIRQFAL